MKYKVSELTNERLNVAVAMAEGLLPNIVADIGAVYVDEFPYLPTEDWAVAGKLIEREGIWLEYEAGQWTAKALNDDGVYVSNDTSPLIAAMRAFVTAKLGAVIEL